MRLRHLGILVAVGALLPVTASAQDQWETEVRAQMTMIEALMETEGYTRYGNVTVDSMRDDATETFTVKLQGGYSYQIVGVCDTDCGDIDFWIYDDKGNKLDEDVSTDDVPIVSVSPRKYEEYQLRVKMYDCTQNPCRYGILQMRN